MERQNRSLLRIAQAEKKDWQKELLKFLMAYRGTPHATTGVNPAKLLPGREICTKIPSVTRGLPLTVEDRHARDNDGTAEQKGKDYADNQRKKAICRMEI